MKCPHCKLINPDTAQRCDCGYDFETKTLKDSYLPESLDEKNTFRHFTRVIKVRTVLIAVISTIWVVNEAVREFAIPLVSMFLSLLVLFFVALVLFFVTRIKRKASG